MTGYDALFSAGETMSPPRAPFFRSRVGLIG